VLAGSHELEPLLCEVRRRKQKLYLIPCNTELYLKSFTNKGQWTLNRNRDNLNALQP
jgi:hypothetical protein